MKKILMMVTMLAVSFAMQAQTKFHDVEANDATGPVKSIKSQMMGRDCCMQWYICMCLIVRASCICRNDQSGRIFSLVSGIRL